MILQEYRNCGDGQEPTLKQVLQAFLDRVNQDTLPVSASRNSLLCAAIIKMSRITKFSVPKITSFIEITTPENENLTWLVRLEMIYEFLYYNYVQDALRQQYLTRVAFSSLISKREQKMDQSISSYRSEPPSASVSSDDTTEVQTIQHKVDTDESSSERAEMYLRAHSSAKQPDVQKKVPQDSFI